MTALTATDARKGFFNLLHDANEQHEIFHIRYRNGDAVLMSEKEYDGLIETLELLSAPGFKEGFEKAQAEVEAKDTVSFEKVFGEEQ
jgi:antitoxin YefM